MTVPPRPGRLVAIEGLDGSGKTTFGAALADRLRAVGRDVVLTERNDVREMHDLQMHLSAAGDMSRNMSCIWGGAELAARFHYVVRPALARGATVLATKYVVTALAQGVARGHPLPFVRRVYDFAVTPDLVLYLDIPPQVSLDRKQRVGSGIGFFEAGLDVRLGLPLEKAMQQYTTGQLSAAVVEESFLWFQSQLRELYDKLLAEYRVLRLDGTLEPTEIVESAVEVLQTGV